MRPPGALIGLMTGGDGLQRCNACTLGRQKALAVRKCLHGDLCGTGLSQAGSCSHRLVGVAAWHTEATGTIIKDTMGN